MYLFYPNNQTVKNIILLLYYYKYHYIIVCRVEAGGQASDAGVKSHLRGSCGSELSEVLNVFILPGTCFICKLSWVEGSSSPLPLGWVSKYHDTRPTTKLRHPRLIYATVQSGDQWKKLWLKARATEGGALAWLQVKVVRTHCLFSFFPQLFFTFLDKTQSSSFVKDNAALLVSLRSSRNVSWTNKLPPIFHQHEKEHIITKFSLSLFI